MKPEEAPLATGELAERIRQFSREDQPRLCTCDHQLQGTGVFYQSVGLIQCATCRHWQAIRKPIA